MIVWFVNSDMSV